MTRHWSGGALILAWAATLAAMAGLRWVLQAGVYRSTLESGRVLHLSGAWPRSFATLMTAVLVALGLVVMVGATWGWYVGRKERAARLIAQRAGHRRVLM